MVLENLPMEIVLCIAKNLTKLKDVNAIVCTHPRLMNQLDDELYKRDAKADDGGAAALWAAEKRQVGTLRKAVIAGAQIPKSDRFNTQVKPSDFVESLTPIPRFPKAHPIIAAAISGSKSCIRYLIRYGVYPNFLDDRFTTPIQAAAARGKVGVVKMLLTEHPEVFRGAFTLRRSLKAAAQWGHMEVVHIIFSYLESPLSGGHLPIKLAAQIVLYEALWHDQPEIVLYALWKGAAVNEMNCEATLWFAADVAPWERVSRERRTLRQEHKAKRRILGQWVCSWREYDPDVMDAALTGCNCALVGLIIQAGFNGPCGIDACDSISRTMAQAHWKRLQSLINLGDSPHLWPNPNWPSNPW
jgi:hypothetical protein